VPCLAINQVKAGLGKGLVDSATLDPHFNLGFKVEWSWLNSCSEAIDDAFINPSFADWALGRGRKGIDKDFTHLRSPT
jgi:hypothetical protein